MTCAGTSDEDRDRASVVTESCHRADRDRAPPGSGVIGWMPIVVVFMRDRVIMAAPW